MVETRSKQPESTQANPAAKSKSKTKGSSKKRRPQPPSGRKKQKQQLVEDDADESFHIDSNDGNNQPRDEPNLTRREEAEEDESAPPAVFLSRFPGLELGDFEKQLDDWTLVSLRQAISKQASKRSKAPGEIQSLVRGIRLEYEKRMLMAALMGAVPEVVIWNLVGEGSKQGHANPWIRFLAFGLPALAEKVPESGDSEGWTRRNKKVSDLWKKLSKDEKDVFRDPYFFALAKLPDLSTLPMDITEPAEDGGDTSLQHLNESMPAPTVHKLTDEQKTKYMPLFEKLVDVEKLHLCHGKPSPSTPVATIQQKSLVELRKAHHAFAVVCQRYQVTYYLAGVSCGSTEGWTQVFSNNLSFAKWASDDIKVPQTLASYIHGQSAAKVVEASKPPQQPSDARRTQLGKELNSLVDAVYKGNKFPKVPDPVEDIKDKGWPIRIVQKPGSLLSEDELKIGHRLARDAIVKNWLKDIANGLFIIEAIPESERPNTNQAQRRPQKSKTKSSSKQTRPRANSGPLSSVAEDGTRNRNQRINSENNEDDITQNTQSIQNTNHSQQSQLENQDSTQSNNTTSNSGQNKSRCNEHNSDRARNPGQMKRRLQALALGDSDNEDESSGEDDHVQKKKRSNKSDEELDDDSDLFPELDV